MTIAGLLKRLDRIEAKRGGGAIFNVVGFRPVTEDEVTDAVANWRVWVADGRASREGNTLYINAPVLTVEEWMARCCEDDAPTRH